MCSLLLVAACTTPSPAVDGQLDCPTDASFAGFADYTEGTVGAPTPDEALEKAIAPYRREHGGEVIVVDEGVASLVVDGREVIVAQAREGPAGGWIVATHQGCAGYES